MCRNQEIRVKLKQEEKESIKNLHLQVISNNKYFGSIEGYAIYFLREQGYNVESTNHLISIKNFTESRQRMIEKYNFSIIEIKNILTGLDKIGMPDLVAWDKDNIYFVEVKSENDSLRISQLAWMQKYPELNKVILYFI